MSKKVYVIAEVGSVHDGSFGNAQRLIDVAVSCGADAVKFQTHLPAAETLRDAPMPSLLQGRAPLEYFARTGFTLEQWKKARAACDGRRHRVHGKPLFSRKPSTLKDIGISRYKIPSGEVSNLPMLDTIAKTGKPVFPVFGHELLG